MQISNRKLYLKYKLSNDEHQIQVLISASILASSLEEKISTGHSMDLAIRCVGIDQMNLEVPGMDDVIEFLIRCWAYGREFSASLWKMRDRRRRPRSESNQIEISMV